MAKPKASTRLSVFKGREAKLNRAIFQALALKGPQTIYDIHKQVRMLWTLKHTRYASVNKRIKNLEGLDFIKKIGTRKTKAGFRAFVYELTARAYVAIFFAKIELDSLIQQLDEETAIEILALLNQNSAC